MSVAPATPPQPQPKVTTHERKSVSLFQREIVTRAIVDSFVKLDPRVQLRATR